MYTLSSRPLVAVSRSSRFKFPLTRNTCFWVLTGARYNRDNLVSSDHYASFHVAYCSLTAHSDNLPLPLFFVFPFCSAMAPLVQRDLLYLQHGRLHGVTSSRIYRRVWRRACYMESCGPQSSVRSGQQHVYVPEPRGASSDHL